MRLKPIEKYLKNYAEVEVHALADFPSTSQFNHVLVIPAFKESSGFIDRFIASTLNQQQALVIVVVNQPDSVVDKTRQQNLVDEIHQLAKPCWQNQNLSLLTLSKGNSQLLLVDRFTQPIPEKQGVGLARKIGADIAAALIHQSIITNSWICSSDADATLPDNYFTSTAELPASSVGACYNFTHQSSDKVIEQANLKYEQALRYYVAGLEYAGSTYAFFTIGSTLVFDCLAYAQVRGFPKKSAGEDFYLLNKIAKLGDISFIETCQIIIEARMSDRVPFGTGPAVSQIIALEQAGEEYCYYHPQLFDLLKQCLTGFETLWGNKGNLNAWYETLPNDIESALKQIGFESFISKHLTHQELQFTKQLQVWFDAFKTLKFLHALREITYANLPLSVALSQAEFVSTVD